MALSAMLSPSTQFAGLIVILLLSALGVAVFAALERALDRVKTMALAGVLGGQISPQELRPRRFALRDLSSGFARLSWVGLMLSALWLVRSETGWTWTNILLTVLGVTVVGHLIQVWVRYRAEMDPTRMLTSMRGFITLWLKSGPLIGAATTVSESLRGRNRRNATEEAEQENAVEEEIRTLLDEAEADENWSEERTDMLESVLGFEETTAREIMTPRVDLDSVPKSASLNDVVRVVVESGHSRLPVYEESDDNILGVVHAKDVLQALMNDGDQTLEGLMRAPLFVYESNTVGEVLREMRASKVPMAIVQDDRGATAGVVTMEDIVEELVGEIHDEYDTDEPEILLE
ncbi:MAG TPA: CBS domain-containing protein, partial [Fimbriimonadaceae bacterium]|nr:CBS domain-containing protein [Fimbriimonadaceae bacterium]